MRVLLRSHHPFDPHSGVSGMLYSLGHSLKRLGADVDFYFNNGAKGTKGLRD